MIYSVVWFILGFWDTLKSLVYVLNFTTCPHIFLFNSHGERNLDSNLDFGQSPMNMCLGRQMDKLRSPNVRNLEYVSITRYPILSMKNAMDLIRHTPNGNWIHKWLLRWESWGNGNAFRVVVTPLRSNWNKTTPKSPGYNIRFHIMSPSPSSMEGKALMVSALLYRSYSFI
jgi:hypothetical protein